MFEQVTWNIKDSIHLTKIARDDNCVLDIVLPFRSFTAMLLTVGFLSKTAMLFSPVNRTVIDVAKSDFKLLDSSFDPIIS